jgi:hypothetical protein
MAATPKREIGLNLPGRQGLRSLPCRLAQSSSQLPVLQQALERGTQTGDVTRLDDQSFSFMLARCGKFPARQPTTGKPAAMASP